MLSESLLDLNSKVQPGVLSGLLGINISQLYTLAQQGNIPVLADNTYKDVIPACITYYKKAVEVKLEKERNEQELRLKKLEATPRKTFSSEDDAMHPLVAAKLQQNIKTERAREAEIWQKVAIKNEEYVAFSEKLSLIEPFILGIKELLLGIAIDFPETQNVIDEGMQNLYQAGIKLIEEAKIDRDNYISEMLNGDVDA